MSRLAVAAAVLLASCARPSLEVIPESELPADVYGTPTPLSVAQLPKRGSVWLVRDGRLVSVPRRLPESASHPDALLQALLAGPSGVTQTAIPEDTRLLSVSLDGGVATLDLSEEFEESAPGEELALRLAQVVYTVTESSQVTSVLFSIEGHSAAVVTANDQVVDRPVSRADYRPFTQPVDEEPPAET